VQQESATFAEAGYDGLVGYGRFSNGSVAVDGAEGAGSALLGLNQGVHYAFGTPLAETPSTPVIVQYSLLGATRATSGSGALGLGTLSGSIAADFVGQRVGVDLSVAFSDPATTRYRMQTTGGVTSLLASEVTTSSYPAGFAGSVPVLRSLSGNPETACASGCDSYIRGFFAGTNAERAGAAYRIFDHDSGNKVVGAATFTQSGSVPLLNGTDIPLNVAVAIDTAPPQNASDAFNHPATTGTLDASGALTSVNAGGLLTRGSAGVAGSSRDEVIGWSRWAQGTLAGAGPYSGSALTGPLSLHAVYGTPTSASDMAALQAAFQGMGATYTLIGGTHPTDAAGASAAGSLNSGSLTAWFGSQTVDVNLGLNTASRGFTVSATGLPISGSTFGGTTNGVSASGCSTCTANIQGFFAGSMASRAGVAYTIKDMGNPVVNGTAAFLRSGTVGQPSN
jgi:hypothetical protein